MADLDKPGVKALMADALDRADPPLDRTGKRRTTIKSTANRQIPKSEKSRNRRISQSPNPRSAKLSKAL